MKISFELLLLLSVVLMVRAQFKKRSECVFPFKYQGKIFDDCVMADAGAPWCSATYEYTGLFFYCNDNQGDAIEKNGAFLSSQKKLMDNKRILDSGNFSIGDICNNCGANLQVVEGSLSALMSLSDDNERQINFLMDVENKNFKDFLQINLNDIKEYLYCPSGWFPFSDDECFHFGPKLTLAEGNAYCQNLGGNMATIKDEKENNQILEKASFSLPKDSAYIIGLTDEQTEGKFRWMDDTESSYTNWNSVEPNNYGGNENCVMVFASSGKWNDISCREKYNVLCRGNTLYLK